MLLKRSVNILEYTFEIFWSRLWDGYSLATLKDRKCAKDKPDDVNTYLLGSERKKSCNQKVWWQMSGLEPLRRLNVMFVCHPRPPTSTRPGPETRVISETDGSWAFNRLVSASYECRCSWAVHPVSWCSLRVSWRYSEDRSTFISFYNQKVGACRFQLSQLSNSELEAFWLKTLSRDSLVERI